MVAPLSIVAAVLDVKNLRLLKNLFFIMASVPPTLLDEANEIALAIGQLVSIVADPAIPNKDENAGAIKNGIFNRVWYNSKKGCPTGRFPKSARLLSRAHYKYLHRNSIRLSGKQISVDICQGKAFSARLGITVSRKFGEAHLRNRFKRVVREAFREIYLSLPKDLELNISPRNNGVYLSKQEILTDLQNLLSRWT
jgi:ribonuclease P protein component